jgi:hypothetical protein
MNAYHALRAALRAMLFPSLRPFDSGNVPFDSPSTSLREVNGSLRANKTKNDDGTIAKRAK